MDTIDYRLLAALNRDGRVATTELARSVQLSPTAVARRHKALEEAGVILGYSANFDLGKLGLSTTVVVRITLQTQREVELAEFEEAVHGCRNVLNCFLMSGTDDYLLLLRVRDLQDFERVHKTHLSRLPHVARIESSFALREIVRRALPANLLEQPNAV